MAGAQDTTLGVLIRAKRNALGLTQTQLAHKIGVADGSRIAAWERNASTPNPHNLRLLQTALEADDDYFAGFIEPPTAISLQALMDTVVEELRGLRQAIDEMRRSGEES